MSSPSSSFLPATTAPPQQASVGGTGASQWAKSQGRPRAHGATARHHHQQLMHDSAPLRYVHFPSDHDLFHSLSLGSDLLDFYLFFFFALGWDIFCFGDFPVFPVDLFTSFIG
jgi:hypothetical protein